MIKIKNKEACCGCGACIASCPKSALELKEDNEGFLYPVVNPEKCIDCGVCEKVCPFIGNKESKLNQAHLYGAKNKNVTEQLNSASGGIFPLLAKYVIGQGGYVFGAAYVNNWLVEHLGISDEKSIDKLSRSKYVQSNASVVYKEVRSHLKDGTLVLFTGTPCQCLGMKKYLRKDYENLYLVDIVCHGVPSPSVWKMYLENISLEMHESVSDIIDIRFKYKDIYTYHWKHPGFMIEWANGKKYIDYSNRTCYENGFLGNLFVRPSCYACQVKSISSGADMTIGDFWGVEKLYPDFYDKKGTSIIFVNTNKGRFLFKAIRQNLEYINVQVEDAIRYNRRIVYSIPKTNKRIKFFKKFTQNKNLDSSVQDLLTSSLLERAFVKIKKIIFDR